jgi:hypothetical protein
MHRPPPPPFLRTEDFFRSLLCFLARFSWEMEITPRPLTFSLSTGHFGVSQGGRATRALPSTREPTPRRWSPCLVRLAARQASPIWFLLSWEAHGWQTGRCEKHVLERR